jgi:hypothetical protein
MEAIGMVEPKPDWREADQMAARVPNPAALPDFVGVQMNTCHSFPGWFVLGHEPAPSYLENSKNRTVTGQ